MQAVADIINQNLTRIAWRSTAVAASVLSILACCLYLGAHYSQMTKTLQSVNNVMFLSMSMGDRYQLKKQADSLIRNGVFTGITIFDSGGTPIVSQGPEVDQLIERYSIAISPRWGVQLFFRQNLVRRSQLPVGYAIGTSEVSAASLLILLLGVFSASGSITFFIIINQKHLAKLIADPISEANQAIDDFQRLDAIASRSYSELQALIKNHMASIERQIKLGKREAQLRQAEVIANTTSQIAHDLKGPMGVFQKVAYGNQEDFIAEQQNLQNAYSRLISMADSIKKADLDAIVKPEMGHMNMTGMMENLRIRAEMASVHLEYSGPTIEKISIDLPKVERLVANLANNAIEAAESKVSVDWCLEAADLVVTVTDDGPGVPDEIKDRLFTRGATFGKDEGTGLGLSFVKHVAQGHGGEATYVRRDGLSVFTVVLRDVVLVDNGSTKMEATVGNDANQSPEAQFLKILVKLDDAGRQNQVCDHLKSRYPKLIITDSFDGLEGCQLAYCEDYDILFQDAGQDVKLIIPSKPEDIDVVVGKIGNLLPTT